MDRAILMSLLPPNYIRKSLMIWFLIIGAETVHGTFRQIAIFPFLGDFTARQVTVFSGSALIFFITWLSIRWMKPPDWKASLAIGLLWVLLTVGFEAGLGHFVFGYTSERIMEDYDISRGGLMGPGLLFMALAPLVAARIRMGPRRA